MAAFLTFLAIGFLIGWAVKQRSAPVAGPKPINAAQAHVEAHAQEIEGSLVIAAPVARVEEIAPAKPKRKARNANA